MKRTNRIHQIAKRKIRELIDRDAMNNKHFTPYKKSLIDLCFQMAEIGVSGSEGRLMGGIE